MRHHVQGLVLLIVMLLALWATVALAGPVVSDALHGEDRALKAETVDPDEVVEPDQEDPLEAPLTGDEVAELQAALIEAGYDPGGIDGQLGPLTRQAANQALTDRSLPQSTTDRELIAILKAEAAGLSPDEVTDPSLGVGDEGTDVEGGVEGLDLDSAVEGDFVG